MSTGLWLGVGTSVHAQIASYLDDQGKRVFVNADPPATRRVTHSSIPGGQPLAAPRPTYSLPRDLLDRLVNEAADRHGLDPNLLHAVIGAESGGNPAAVSPKGALGLMQLVPATAARFGVGDVFDPAQNVEAGAHYLRELLDRFNGSLPKALAAYNAGEGAVERSGGVPNYPETRSYVRKVQTTYFQSGSAHLSADDTIRSSRIRRTVDENGRIVFTNE